MLFLKKTYRALKIISDSLSDQFHPHIIGIDNPKTAWERLNALLNNTSSLNASTLARIYQELEIESDDLESYFAKLRLSIENQKAINVLYTDEQIIAKIVNDLSRSGRGENFRVYYQMASSQQGFKLTYQEAEQMILTMCKNRDPSNKNEMALTASQQTKKKEKRKYCSYCKKPNQVIKECWRKNPHLAPQREKKPNQTSLFNVSLIDHADHPWFIDTGASNHQTYQREILHDTRKPKPDEMFVGGNKPGTQLTVELIGSVFAQVWNEENWQQVTIKNVRFVPNASFNLFSVGAMPKHIITVIQGEKTTFFNGSDKLMVAYKNKTKYKNLFNLVIKVIESTEDVSCATLALVDSLPIQHERFVHISPRRISQMASEGSVLGLPQKLKGNIDYCTPCLQGKMTDISHPTVKPKHEHLESGEYIHMDIRGYKHTSYWHNRYFLLIKDELTGYRKVYFLKTKSEALTKYLLFENEVKMETGNNVIKIRVDQGSEFVSSRFLEHIKSRGIILEYACKATPQKNGKSERENRTIIEHATAILTATDLGEYFWDESVNTVTYVLNRTTIGNSKITPYELWHGEKPTVQHFHIFGSEGQALIKDNNLHQVHQNCRAKMERNNT